MANFFKIINNRLIESIKANIPAVKAKIQKSFVLLKYLYNT